MRNASVFLFAGEFLLHWYDRKEYKIALTVIYNGVRLATLAVVTVAGQNALLASLVDNLARALDEVHNLRGVLVGVKADGRAGLKPAEKNFVQLIGEHFSAERALAALECLKAFFLNSIKFYHLGASRVKFRACF